MLKTRTIVVIRILLDIKLTNNFNNHNMGFSICSGTKTKNS